MKILLLLMCILIATIGYAQKSYKPLFQKDKVSCMIVKDQTHIIQFNLGASRKKDNSTKTAATIGLIGFAGIMSANYWTGTEANLKTEKAGYLGIMGTLVASAIVIQIVF